MTSHPTTTAHDEQPGQAAQGAVSPLASLARPVTAGAALALLLVNLVALAWFYERQSSALDEVREAVSSTSLSVSSGSGVPDLDACWLIGTLARAEGKSEALSAAMSGSDAISDCEYAAHNGAMGRGRNG